MAAVVLAVVSCLYLIALASYKPLPAFPHTASQVAPCTQRFPIPSSSFITRQSRLVKILDDLDARRAEVLGQPARLVPARELAHGRVARGRAWSAWGGWVRGSGGGGGGGGGWFTLALRRPVPRNREVGLLLTREFFLSRTRGP